MGLGSFIEKKLKGDPEQKQRNQRLKEEIDEARWEGKRKGSLERARKEGYRQGKQGSGIMGAISNISAHVDPTGGFGDAGFGGGKGSFGFDPSGSGNFGGSSIHRKHASSHKQGKGTTIKVNGATITVRNRTRNRQHHRRRQENDFPF